MSASAIALQSAKAEVARLCQTGQFGDALKVCAPLCDTRPDDPELWFLHGAIHGALGDFRAAEACCRKALALAPSQPALHCNLGIALLRQNRSAEASEAFRNALNLQPAYAEALTGLGDACHAQGEFENAVKHYRASLSVAGNQPQTLYNLAQATMHTADNARADQYFEQAASLAPALEKIWLEWSRYLLDQGNFSRAIQILEKAITRLPDSAALHYQSGFALHEIGQYQTAMERFDRCLRIDNRHQESRFARAMLLRKVGRLSEAAEGLSSIVETDPTNAQAHAGLAALYKDEGKIEEALAHGRRAVELDPGNAEFHGNLIMNMHYSDCVTPSELFEAHRAWGLAHAPTGVAPVQRIEPCDPEMPLRIGYVSPDFRRHSVAYFISSILANHDRSRHTVFCYSNLVPDRTDAMTTLLRGRADVWREIATMSDQYAAEMIGADGIDILVDLAGHSAGNRLGVFALRAAPVQITWLGYPGTTGMVDMDYRLTDLIADPAPEADRFCTEHLIRIPNGFLCYEPAQDAPNPGPLPHDRNGYVTFGSFNNLAKVNDALLVAWGTILKTVPRSRLVLKSIALADDNVCKHLLRRFGALGVDTGRVELVSWQPKTTAHLGLYQQIDIALDTFPYNGTTTTCEALWMGVPAITLQGETHANRVGASLLSHVGLPELVADTSQQYIEFATALACDVDRLRLLRATLRDRLRGASLLDCRGFTYRLEQCYRHVWRHYCDEQPD